MGCLIDEVKNGIHLKAEVLAEEKKVLFVEMSEENSARIFRING